MESLLIIIGVVASIAGLTVWNGYVLSVLWGWFAVSIFHVQSLSIKQAIGIALIASCLTHQSQSSDKKKTGADIAGAIVGVFVGGLVLLFIGWIVK